MTNNHQCITVKAWLWEPETLLPFFIGLCAFVLQVDDVARVVAAHLAITVLDHRVFVVAAEQVQASPFDSLHLSDSARIKIQYMPQASRLHFHCQFLHTVQSPASKSYSNETLYRKTI